jgi:hypothetical protein
VAVEDADDEKTHFARGTFRFIDDDHPEPLHPLAGRQWLVASIRRQYPEHPWLSRLTHA